MGFWEKLKKIYMGDVFGAAISEADEAFFDDLEEMLILADVGLTTATEAVQELRTRMIEDKISGQEPVKACLREILAERLNVGDTRLNLSTKPSVVLVVGVNGVGKTTSIGKMANAMRLEGKRVLLCASDTFRAAAADQLEIWANRARCEIVRQKEGADPGAVLFDALQAARARGVDVVLCDTAGRLHNKANLMAELAKLRKIIDREMPEAALEILLVLDATTGQNGLIQAKQFQEISGCTGIVLTKLDGTAKGGIVIAIAQELQVPVKFVGLGEDIKDLQPFDAKAYVEALI
jgi:fused signal recognition particle receptor